MKIDSTPNPAPGADRQRRDPCAIRHGLVFVRAGGRCGSSGGDRSVNLSGLSGQLRSVSASGNGDIDTGLVQSIKDALNNGTLTIDANKIADGVLNTARELLQQQRPGN